MSERNFRAIVTGGTGAIGKYLVAELLTSPAWSKVTVVGRSEWKVPAGFEDKIDIQQAKEQGRLIQHIIDMEKLEDSVKSSPDNIDNIAKMFTIENADASFCVLGTTHKDAGSNAKFRRVDLDYVSYIATLSRDGKIPYFCHVTAQNVDGFFSKFSNYSRTKADAEKAIKALAFPMTSIFRPGFLDRGDVSRSMEKFALTILPSSIAYKVQDVAKAMRLDAEYRLNNPPAEGTGPEYKVISGGSIYDRLK